MDIHPQLQTIGRPRNLKSVLEKIPAPFIGAITPLLAIHRELRDDRFVIPSLQRHRASCQRRTTAI